MKLSVIFIYDGNEQNTQKTLECVKGSSGLEDKIHLIFADMTGRGEAFFKALADDLTESDYLSAPEGYDDNALIKSAFTFITGDYFTVVRSGDSFDAHLFEKCINLMEKHNCSVAMGEKLFEYDLVITHYGLTAYEAAFAGCLKDCD